LLLPPKPRLRQGPVNFVTVGSCFLLFSSEIEFLKFNLPGRDGHAAPRRGKRHHARSGTRETVMMAMAMMMMMMMVVVPGDGDTG
jgi:hypothetical protein